MENKDKIVIVTGATRGIGEVIARSLVSAGWSVVVTGTSEESALNAGKDIGGAAYVLRLDDDSSVKDFVKRISEDFPQGIFGLINNAGYCRTENLGSGNKEFDKIMGINARGPQMLVDGLVSAGVISDGGRIINISSQLGLVTRPGYAAYCASKAALNALTRVWASELGRRKISVNAICPGWVDVGITDEDLGRLAIEKGKDPKEFRRELEESLDLKRLQTPEEVASVVGFFLSEESSGITGQVLPLSGPLM